MPFVPHTAGRVAASPTVEITAHAMIAVPLSVIPSLRSGGWPASAPLLPPRFLRHADEQTVVGMHAVLAAVAGLAAPRPRLDTHGVIAASCQAGRISGAQALVQARKGGGVAVSTHVIPQCSLHSLAGALSVGLGMHGPNIGVCGGSDALAEGLLTAFSWLEPSGLPACDAVWLVITGWDDEPSLDAEGAPVTDPVCRAVAVSLTRPGVAGAADTKRLMLALDPHDRGASGSPPGEGETDSLRRLGESLAENSHTDAVPRWSHSFPWGGRVNFVVATAAALREAA